MAAPVEDLFEVKEIYAPQKPEDFINELLANLEYMMRDITFPKFRMHWKLCGMPMLLLMPWCERRNWTIRIEDKIEHHSLEDRKHSILELYKFLTDLLGVRQSLDTKIFAVYSLYIIHNTHPVDGDLIGRMPIPFPEFLWDCLDDLISKLKDLPNKDPIHVLSRLLRNSFSFCVDYHRNNNFNPEVSLDDKCYADFAPAAYSISIRPRTSPVTEEDLKSMRQIYKSYFEDICHDERNSYEESGYDSCELLAESIRDHQDFISNRGAPARSASFRAGAITDDVYRNLILNAAAKPDISRVKGRLLRVRRLTFLAQLFHRYQRRDISMHTADGPSPTALNIARTLHPNRTVSEEDLAPSSQPEEPDYDSPDQSASRDGAGESLQQPSPQMDLLSPSVPGTPRTPQAPMTPTLSNECLGALAAIGDFSLDNIVAEASSSNRGPRGGRIKRATRSGRRGRPPTHPWWEPRRVKSKQGFRWTVRYMVGDKKRTKSFSESAHGNRAEERAFEFASLMNKEFVQFNREEKHNTGPTQPAAPVPASLVDQIEPRRARSGGQYKPRIRGRGRKGRGRGRGDKVKKRQGQKRKRKTKIALPEAQLAQCQDALSPDGSSNLPLGLAGGTLLTSIPESQPQASSSQINSESKQQSSGTDSLSCSATVEQIEEPQPSPSTPCIADSDNDILAFAQQLRDFSR